MKVITGRYDIVIERIEPKRNSGYRYLINVYWNKAKDLGDISWAHTIWGAHREAKRLVKKHELPAEKREIIEEYVL